ncbi:MAG: NYN domain-containing protein [Candidatus Heimdallarchaeaceae archaeon]|jgi:uncharacterized protein (TIGR00288 family)
MSEMEEEVEEETLDERNLYERIVNRILSSSSIQALRGRITGEKKIAVFVDGPNFLRKVKNRQIKLEEVDEKIQDLGRASIKKVILNEHASKNLIQAITNSGYKPLVSHHDTYITLAVEVMEAIKDGKNVDVVVIASRHARVTPILAKVKEKGLETVVLGFEPGFSIAVQKMANQTLFLE